MKFPNNTEECEEIYNISMKYADDFMELLDSGSMSMETLRKIDLTYYQMAKVSNIMEILKSVHVDCKLRNFAGAKLLELGQVILKCTSDPRIYKIMKSIKNTEFELDEEDQYYIEREMKQMETDGVNLNNNSRQQLLKNKC